MALQVGTMAAAPPSTLGELHVRLGGAAETWPLMIALVAGMHRAGEHRQARCRDPRSGVPDEGARVMPTQELRRGAYIVPGGTT